MGQDRQATTSMRLGERLGRVCRGYLSLERRMLNRSNEMGVPSWLAQPLCWIFKLCLIGIFLYLTFWIAVIVILVALITWRLLRGGYGQLENRPEWRDGLLGYGLYDETGARVDPYDPDEQS